jgi:hypothetical protein
MPQGTGYGMPAGANFLAQLGPDLGRLLMAARSNPAAVAAAMSAGGVPTPDTEEFVRRLAGVEGLLITLCRLLRLQLLNRRQGKYRLSQLGRRPLNLLEDLRQLRQVVYLLLRFLLRHQLWLIRSVGWGLIQERWGIIS